MKKKNLSVAVALVATAALTLGPAMAASATPWDGNSIPFQHGLWDVSADSFNMDDVNVIDPAGSTSPSFDEYTDIWDGASEFSVSLNDWSTEDYAWAASDADLDVTTDPTTEDLVITAPMSASGLVWENTLDITGELRVLKAGDVYRQTFFVTNTTGSPVTASFRFYTDFGSSGEIYNYQNQSDAVLAVPAAEGSVSATALNTAGAQWAVHSNHSPTSGADSDCDAPGGVAYGLAASANPAEWDFDGDDWNGYVNDVIIPAGGTIAVAAFWNWTPDLLVAGNYSNDFCTDAEMNAYADAVTTRAAVFNAFTGCLTNGLSGYNVVNWGDLTSPAVFEAANEGCVTPTPDPTLPDTGTDTSTAITVSAVGGLALMAGATLLLMRRRALR